MNIYTCNQCPKSFKSPVALRSHINWHNPEYAKKSGAKTKQELTNLRMTSINGKLRRQEKYNLSPQHCIQCQLLLPYEYRHNKFCNKSCSASYNNTNRKPRPKELVPEKMSCKVYSCKACGQFHQSNEHRKLCPCGLSEKYKSFKGLQLYFDLKIDNIGTKQFILDFEECRKKAKNLYSTNSLPSLATVVNHPDKTGGNIGKLIKNLDIQFDSRGTSHKKSLLQERSSPNGGPTTYKSGTFQYQSKKYYYRSSYELKFAKKLMSSDVSFEMESVRIEYFDSVKKTHRIAIPDFIIGPDIVEIKSNFTYDQQNMIDKFEAYKKMGYTPHLMLEHRCVDVHTGELIKNPKYSC